MDTYMTKDPFEKENMFTDINRRLTKFTLRKSVGLKNFHSATGKKNNPTIS
jgi:hypothetical protein